MAPYVIRSNIVQAGVTATNALRMIPGNDDEAGFYVPFSQTRGSDFTLALRVDGDPLTLSAAVKQTIKDIDARIYVSGFGTHAEMAEGYRTGYHVMSLLAGLRSVRGLRRAGRSAVCRSAPSAVILTTGCWSDQPGTYALE